MAYVESFYLDANLEAALETPVELEQVSEDLGELVLLDDVTICRVVESQQKFLEKPTVGQVVSDYCGFESDEMPPVYRAQMRMEQKKKQLVEQDEKSQYAYHVNLDKEKEVKGKKQVETVFSTDYYVPGFSPPQQQMEEIHKMDDFKLPTTHAICATEHVFQMSTTRQNDVSQYIPMPNEDGEMILTAQKKAEIESAISYTDNGFTTTAESSVLTATLGPAFGCLPSTMSAMSPVHQKSTGLPDKYKGLSAFRPVSGSIESQYAFPELN